jgi:hypothetical protein
VLRRVCGVACGVELGLTPLPSDNTDLEAFRDKLFDCVVDLPSWKLHVAQLTQWVGRDLGNVMETAISGALSHLRRSCPDRRLERNQTIAAVRDSLTRAGVDPVTNPPSSELLIRDLLARSELARGPIPWEFLTILTAKSFAPWAVLDRRTLEPPLVFRKGEPGERLEATSGTLECAGLPVLADQGGVKASPWTYDLAPELDRCTDPVFVCFLPKEIFRTIEPKGHVGRTVLLTWAYRFVFERTCSHAAATG